MVSRGSLSKASLAATIVLLLVACEAGHNGKLQIDRLPAWIEPTNQEVIEIAEIRALLEKDFPGIPVRWSDHHYERISYLWLQRFLEWTWSTHLEVGGKYTAESFDCEDFALTFNALANRAAAQGGQTAAPLIARIVVIQSHAFGGVPATPGKRHELIAIATDRGVFVVEPQPREPFRIAPLSDYHNRIVQIVLGD